ncbi:DUF4292 domain-containing protein [Brumimicrobium mesophilum]|uniref:DUF4292 domain-containing protein n=1 Tax=Brumimicrobium mesophilum TaxID=392717 RepID=UPI000D13F184|nr:DUF4292 domain-containing protein [Brumimicrobium mesophilum]
MLQNITKYIFSILLLSSLVSCGSRRNADLENEEKLSKVREEVFVDRLDSLSKQRPDHYYAKLNSKYSDSKFNVSFKTSIRMVADSALHALITFARIPIYNVMVTPDTLTMVDKRNNCYMIEDMAYLKKTFGIDFKHKNIEELILGMPVAWDKKNFDYHLVKDPYNYVIASTTKRRVWQHEDENEVKIRYFMSEDTKSLSKMIIDSPKDTTTITINYYDREMQEGYSIPQSGDINVETPRDKLYVDFKYNKSSVNDPRVLYLAIPNKYERCE